MAHPITLPEARRGKRCVAEPDAAEQDREAGLRSRGEDAHRLPPGRPGRLIKVLSEAVGLDLTVDETESGVGDFSVDILATDMQFGSKVVIENQLEDTNHDHLGKLI